MFAGLPIHSRAGGTTTGLFMRPYRVLVLGAGGWFGRTALALLTQTDCKIMAVGSRAADIELGGRRHSVTTWSDSAVGRFEPELVLDFAFLTRDKVSSVGVDAFARINNELMGKVLRVSRMPSVKGVLTISSGAATQPRVPGHRGAAIDPYGQMKSHFEEELQVACAAQGKTGVIARAWSVSGAFVREPSKYAFSSFVLSAIRRGEINIESSGLVYRRYCAVEDLLAVAFHRLVNGAQGVFDSGGPRVEMEELASAVTKILPGTRVVNHHPDRDRKVLSEYHSTDEDWQKRVKEAGLAPLSLEGQIRNVRSALENSI